MFFFFCNGVLQVFCFFRFFLRLTRRVEKHVTVSIFFVFFLWCRRTPNDCTNLNLCLTKGVSPIFSFFFTAHVRRSAHGPSIIADNLLRLV